MARLSEPEPKQQVKVVCRPAREGDTPDVLDLTRLIWEGDDYVPYVWADWLGDRQGLLAVAEHQGRVLGLGKLTRLTEVDWWLEGLRVHPDFEGREIATQLHDHLLDHWYKNGRGTIRLATSAERVQVHRLCSRSGFHRVGECTYYKAEALADGKHSFKAVPMDEMDQVLAWIEQFPFPEMNAGLMDLGWQWAAPHRDLIEDSLHEERAFWWLNERGIYGGLTTYWKDDWEVNQPERGLIPTAQLFSYPIENLQQGLLDFRRLGNELGCRHVAWLAPIDKQITRILEGVDYRREWEGSLYIFAKTMEEEEKPGE
jgi:GNAT superfamily N-acetyltransferase